MSKKASKPTISFIVPALNEEENIERTVNDALKAIGTNRFADYELILINDGSTDATGEIMESLAKRHDKVSVIHNKWNIGLGATYTRGVAAAQFEYVMIIYGDGGVPGSSLPGIFDLIGTADIVIPYMTNLKDIKTTGRLITSWGYTTLLNLLFGHRIRYYNGPSVHRLDLLRRIEITSTGFAFQGEVLVKLLKLGCSYTEVPVQGAIGRKQSTALRTNNLTNIAKTLYKLFWEVQEIDPVPELQIKREPRRSSI